MQKRNNILPFFIAFFLLSSILFFLSTKNITLGFGFVDNMLFPIESTVFKIVTFPQHMQQKQALQKQDTVLIKAQQIADYNKLKQDNAALHDQFVTSQSQSYNLLPADIIGAPAFIPGVSKPENIIIGQGKRNGVKIGQAVIYKDTVLGVVKKVTDYAAMVQLVSSNGVSFPAKTSETNAIGVLKGSGNNTMVLDNVVLSDELKVGDLVVTAMGEDITSKGFPPGFILGKIISVEKNPSSLFQRASLTGLVDVTKLSLVFVVLGKK